VLLAFVDESVKADRYYAYAAILADAEATKRLTDALNRIANEAARRFDLDPRIEIHAHLMFQGKGDWADVPSRYRVHIHEQIVNAVVDAGVEVLLRAVHIPRLRARQDERRYDERFPPDQVAFMHILQRLQARAAALETHALVIADERSDRERHRERFNRYQEHGTPGSSRASRLDRLLDTVHFAPSHRSRMLQAADLVAFTWTRHRTVIEQDRRKQVVMERLTSKILGRAFGAGEWPPGGDQGGTHPESTTAPRSGAGGDADGVRGLPQQHISKGH
jgi:hypothetical protein